MIVATFRKYPDAALPSLFNLHKDEISYYIEIGLPTNGKIRIKRLDQNKISFADKALAYDSHSYSDRLCFDEYEEVDA